MKRCYGCMELYNDEFDICPHCGYMEGADVEESVHMAPGTLLGDRYIIGKVLGFGGFGVTYLGWDGKLEQKVAIKEYLPSEFSTRIPGQSRITVFNGDKNEQFYDGLKKFVDEARLLAKFQNEEGIVKVFDSFVENDTAYIIMEYLDGETLSDYMAREGTIPEDRAVEMLMPVMKSLQVVHQEGLLHRDIAPNNIFLTKTGEIKLIDFGASRYATTSHSRSLTVIIKPGYSPEEQYRSTSDQGPHTDVYALGACLYKMVTGKTPPDAMERRAKFEAQNKDILDAPRKLNKQISIIRENAILNAMNVRIEDRTPNVQEFMNELNSTVAIKRKNGRIKKIDIYGWPWWFKALVAMFAIAFVTMATLMATGVIKVESVFADGVIVPEGMVSIPELEGLTSAKATKKTTSAKLNISIVGSVVSDYVDAGKVVMQTPASGLYYSEYSTVSIYISRGNGEVVPPEDGISTVPYIIGLTEAEVLADLETAGLGKPEITYVYDDNMAEGLVLTQSEEFGEQLPVGTVLKLQVSLGSEPFELPDVYMQTRAEAERTLQMLGLNVEYVIEESPDYVDDMIVAQSIEVGTMVRKTDTIVLTVSKYVHIHDYTWSIKTTKNPTCTEEGEQLCVCECGEIKKESLAKLEHTATIDAAVAPTCLVSGKTEGSHCAVCGTTLVAQSSVPAKGHNEVVVGGKAATCTETGLTDGKVCAVCGVKTLEQAVIPAKGHKEAKVAGKPATCTTTGLTDGKKCSVCQVVLTKQNTIAATGHVYDGTYDADCNVCGAVREIPMKTQYGYYHCTNGESIVVCGYWAHINKGWSYDEIRYKYIWVDQPLTKLSANRYHTYDATKCPQYKCNVSTWSNEVYMDSNGVVWYNQTTRVVPGDTPEQR